VSQPPAGTFFHEKNAQRLFKEKNSELRSDSWSGHS